MTGLVVERDGAVDWITLRRPKAHNALNGPLLEALDEALSAATADPDVRVVVITGAGRTFCAGADLEELRGLDAGQARALLSRGQALFRRLENPRCPVIAAVNGPALGGGFELALACSFVLAAETAFFALPESGLGLIPGYGGTQRLPRLIGAHAARHLMLTGYRLSAERAYQLGLLPLPPVPAGDLTDLAREVAGSIAPRSPRASSWILAATRSVAATEIGLDHETVLAAIAAAGPDAAEGIAAFRARREPRFPSFPGEAG